MASKVRGRTVVSAPPVDSGEEPSAAGMVAKKAQATKAPAQNTLGTCIARTSAYGQRRLASRGPVSLPLATAAAFVTRRASDYDYSLPAKAVVYSAHTRPGFTGAFPASNEFDWFLDQLDTRPADVVVGFGNNNVWDVACRRDASHVVIADHSPRVLEVQHFLYRPLLAIAETPADFLAMLGGVPIDPALRHAPLEQVFAFIEQQRKALPENAPERLAFITQVESKIAAATGDAEAAYVAGHMRWIAQAKRSHEETSEDYPLASFAYSGVDDPYIYFRARYDPAALRAGGATDEQLAHPRFSPLASPESFAWLRRVFAEERVHYVRADISDPRAYVAIGDWARSQGRRVDGLSTNNIWDYAYKDPGRVTSLAARTMRAAIEAMPIGSDFSVYRTRATEPPHRYERYDVNTMSDIGPQLAKAGNAVDALDWRSDAERALVTLERFRPAVDESRRVGVRLFFGKELHVYCAGTFYEHSETLKATLDGRPFYMSGVDARGKPQDELLLPLAEDRERLQLRIFEHLLNLAPSYPGIADYLLDVGIPMGTTAHELPELFSRAADIRGRRWRPGQPD